jgi:SAM-dependent methyltransferase
MNEAEMRGTLDDYFRLMSMKGGVEVFHAARRAGVLKAVAGGAATAEAVAGLCGLDARAAGLLLEALRAMKLVTRGAEGYQPAPVLQLLAGTYEDLSSQYWEYLSEYLKTGRPMQRLDDPAEQMKHYAAQAGALHRMMMPSAVAAARLLGIGTQFRNMDILDVGAGSGVWGLTFAQHDAGARVMAVDWPPVLAAAVEHARSAGLSDRFIACPGDCHAADFGTGCFDLAVVGNLAHLETQERLVALFRRLRAALKRGGRLAIAEVFQGQPGGELNAALYELGLALRTEKGRVHGREALDGVLRASGFAAGGEYQPIPVTPFTMGLMIAKKED